MPDSTAITANHLQHCLGLPSFNPERAHRAMIPPQRPFYPPPEQAPRQAGVLALIHPEPQDAEALHIVLTRRTEHLRGHSGQISFPGGRRDPEDASFTATALRETCEELGICADPIQVLGALTSVYIPPSNYQVHPRVGLLTHKPQMRPNPAEVAEVFSVPLSALLDPSQRRVESWPFNGQTVNVPYFLFKGHKVWGATAIMLNELAERLRVVLS